MTIIRQVAFEDFPECPSYGFTTQPQYLVKIVAREGGYERADLRWARPMVWFTAVPVGPRDEGDIQNILAFWHAVGGRTTPFRFKDWSDYKSCFAGDDITALDQLIFDVGAGSDGNEVYKLVKEYFIPTSETIQDREITQPIGSTILIANDSGDVQDSSTWTLDETSGLLVLGDGFVGVPSTWGGEFMVPVRFNSELDLNLVDKQMQSVQFQLIEKRLRLPKTVAA